MLEYVDIIKYEKHPTTFFFFVNKQKAKCVTFLANVKSLAFRSLDIYVFILFPTTSTTTLDNEILSMLHFAFVKNKYCNF